MRQSSAIKVVYMVVACTVEELTSYGSGAFYLSLSMYCAYKMKEAYEVIETHNVNEQTL